MRGALSARGPGALGVLVVDLGRIWFDSSDSLFAARFSIDSFYEKNSIFQGLPNVIDKTDSLVSRFRQGNKVFEKYVSKHKPDASYSDSSYLEFDKPSDRKAIYSLSESIETKRKLRITRVQFIYNETVDAAGNDIPRRVLDFQEGDYNDPHEIMLREILKRARKLR